MTTDLGSDELGYDLPVQRDGKIVLSGGSLGGSTFDFAVLRYLGR